MKRQSRSSVSFEQLQNLISCIYDAALNANNWDNALKKISNALKAEQGNMRILNTESKDVQLVYNHNKDLHWNKLYKEHYIHMDPWLKILETNKTIISCTHHHLTNKKYEELEFHSGMVTPQGTHYGIGGKINISNTKLGFIAFNRDRKKQGFENNYLEALQLLTPHLQKALLINEKTQNIELKQNLLSDALNQISSPLLLVDKNGKIAFINQFAEQLIEHQRDISIKNNHLSITEPEKNRSLQKLIHQATYKDSHSLTQQAGAMCFTNSATQISLSILVSPVNPNMVNIDTTDNENALLILSTHQPQEPLPAELLTDLYNLTPAEARLTVELCNGRTLDEIAEIFSLSKNTLRSQLRSSFNKTGTSRQAELIRLINTGPAGIINIT